MSRCPALESIAFAWIVRLCLVGVLTAAAGQVEMWADEVTRQKDSNSHVTPVPAPHPEFSFERATALLRSSCAECHADGADEGGLALEHLWEAEDTLKSQYERW